MITFEPSMKYSFQDRERLLFNAKLAVFQLHHGQNIVHYDATMISVLWPTNTLS